ncbi:MAG TPA: hypothetical protein VMV92_41175 [Streptosporangiaceae bacterium]|nr:hypothetical protein [Streptosporangiaceae bacterium]
MAPRMQHGARVRRVYDDPVPRGGARALMDRACPRGLRTTADQPDERTMDVAPPAGLRRQVWARPGEGHHIPPLLHH